MRGLPTLPYHIITAITHTPRIINQWRDYRAQYLQAMIEPLAYMYGLRDRRFMVDITSLLEHTWAFELGFLQSSGEKSFAAFYSLFCPIYDSSCTKKKLTPFYSPQIIEYKRAGIEPGDPFTYNMKVTQQDNN